MKTATLSTATILLILFGGLFGLSTPALAAECPEICQAYLKCVESTYPGDSTEAQMQTILEGCQSGCERNLPAARACYEDADGAAGTVASCEEFSNCLLQVN